VIYTVLIVPISIARFASYAGARVPAAFTFLADVVFALGGRFAPCLDVSSPHIITPAPHLTVAIINLGLANLIHFYCTRRRIPDVTTMPDLSMPRSRLDKKDTLRAVGITPFTTPMSSDTTVTTEDRPGMVTTVSDGEVTVSSWSENKDELGDA
jgi:hypothetical protein